MELGWPIKALPLRSRLRLRLHRPPIPSSSGFFPPGPPLPFHPTPFPLHHGSMGIVVQKYGGSSVADIDKIRGVARRVAACRAGGDQPVVVVSAMGKTTDSLMDLARQVSASPAQRELDMLVSVGERITMALLAMAIHDLGHPAISFTGSQSGIITDERHFDARVVEVRPGRILQAIDQGFVVIVAGYQGVSRNKEVTTLGRGGSDTTAVALAAALEADRCEICSDVDGVWTADPRVVADARPLAQLSHGEVLELAHGGAKVLAATAVEHARQAGVAIWARSTFAPGPGTRVVSEGSAPPSSPRVVAVAGEAFVPRLVSSLPLTKAGDLLLALDSQGVRWRQSRGDEEGLSLWLDPRCQPDVASALKDLLNTPPFLARLEVHCGSVTLAGAGVGASGPILTGSLATLGARGIAPVECLASPYGVSFLLPREQVTEGVQALHARFLGGISPPPASG